MPIVPVSTLKSYFETGDRPSQSNYVDLIDTFATPAFNVSAFGTITLGSAATTAQVLANTSAFTRAVSAAYLTGGSAGAVVNAPSGVISLNAFAIKRYVEIHGVNPAATELFRANGVNADFITSENFSSLTGTGLTVVSSTLVPSWFGLKHMRVNGNKNGNTSGRCIAFYGPAPALDDIVFLNGPEDNMYTEYSNISGSQSWRGQEEGRFGVITSRNSDGVGWLFRGPHNSRIIEFTTHNHDSWGFVTETSGNFDGGLDWIGCVHSYANGNDLGQQYGEVVRIDSCVIDGDCLLIKSAGVQISKIRAAFQGGAVDGITVSANGCAINNVFMDMWVSSSANTGIRIRGNDNSIERLFLTNPSNRNNDGVIVSGNNNNITNVDIQGFNQAGRYAVKLYGVYNNIQGFATNNHCGFFYGAGGNHNRVNLEVFTASGQTTVSGASPGSTDRFMIRSGGFEAKSTRTRVVTTAANRIDLTTSAVQNQTIPHGLLYTPGEGDVFFGMSRVTNATDYEMAYGPIFVSADETNVTYQAKLRVPSATGGAAANVYIYGKNGGE